MTDDRVDRRDQELVDRIRATYRAPERSDAQRAAFRARLSERLRQEGDRDRPTWVLGLAGLAGFAVAAAIVLLVTVGGTGIGEPEPTTIVRDEGAPSLEARGEAESSATLVEDAIAVLALGYEYDYELEDGTGTSQPDDLGAALPDDYAAIESLFLGS